MPWYVNVSCAQLHGQPSYHSELESQVVLWEKVEPLEKQADFCKIRAEDGYEAWLNENQITETNWPHNADSKLFTHPAVTRLYAEPVMNSRSVGDALTGSRLPVIDYKNDWYQIMLPDGQRAWLTEENFVELGSLTRNNIIDYAGQLMGIPYHWAGKTPKAFDCSGFTQFIHKMFGIHTRRDAWMQFEDAYAVGEHITDGQPGDLLFFSEKKDKITHVGFALGQGRILHARGKIKINSLIEGRVDFDAQLVEDFVAVKTFIK
ncbi:MAG: hypothetical protein GF313_10570 [Caldithrix sp.]|nr:hypothetical protein [Caldithrix sp.]